MGRRPAAPLLRRPTERACCPGTLSCPLADALAHLRGACWRAPACDCRPGSRRPLGPRLPGGLRQTNDRPRRPSSTCSTAAAVASDPSPPPLPASWRVARAQLRAGPRGVHRKPLGHAIPALANWRARGRSCSGRGGACSIVNNVVFKKKLFILYNSNQWVVLYIIRT